MLYFVVVFFCYEQHAKAFSIVLFNVFVVHFVRPANGSDVAVIAACEKPEPLVNDDVVHYKIG